ncbi:MAG: hypothetical protein IKS51_03165 [Erysipelotrichaceae bacterium]|nr:hypothetical protein [Erysipelotrichaceae bacterium]
MTSDDNSYNISKELTGLFRLSKEDVSEDTAKRIEATWNGLQAFVEEINKAARGESTVIDLKETNLKEAGLLAERAAFWKLNQILTEALIEDGTIEQNDLKHYLQEQMDRGIDLTDSEIFMKGLRLCTDDELLYRIAKSAPRNRSFSFGDVAASMIKSEEYRYAMISSNIKGRKTLIHDLAISRELNELLAIRILLTDSYVENKRESMYVINSEELLMLAYLYSFSYRNTAKERLKEIGSAYPERYFEMEQEEKDAVMQEWYAKACEYAERLIDLDQEMNEKLDSSLISTSLLIGFLAACHPDETKRIEYAKKITSEELAAYVGAVTAYTDVKKILATKIHSKELLDALLYCDSDSDISYLIKDREEKRIAFCLEILKNTDNEETRQYLTKKMEEAK